MQVKYFELYYWRLSKFLVQFDAERFLPQKVDAQLYANFTSIVKVLRFFILFVFFLLQLPKW